MQTQIYRQNSSCTTCRTHPVPHHVLLQAAVTITSSTIYTYLPMVVSCAVASSRSAASAGGAVVSMHSAACCSGYCRSAWRYSLTAGAQRALPGVANKGHVDKHGIEHQQCKSPCCQHTNLRSTSRLIIVTRARQLALSQAISGRT